MVSPFVGFYCLQSFELCGTKFSLHLLVGMGLVPNISYLQVLWCSLPLAGGGAPSTCGFSFHDNDGIMSYGVILLSFSPPW